MYIQTLYIIFFESIGKSSEFEVNWYDTPEKWELQCAVNAINIDVRMKENTENILFKVTFFVTTGTIQIQGNYKDCFITEIFPCLKSLANKLGLKIDPNNNNGDFSGNMEETLPKKPSENSNTSENSDEDKNSHQQEENTLDKLEGSLVGMTDKILVTINYQAKYQQDSMIWTTS